MPQIDILCHQAKPLGLERGYILLSHWAKEFHIPHKIITGIASAIGCP